MSISTYHCLCAELVLATTSPIDQFPSRTSDGAYILQIASGESLTASTNTVLKSITFDSSPVILKLEDGFEKRYLAKCARCGVVLGYGLDESLFEGGGGRSGRREGVIYVLKGGVMGTEEMERGTGAGEERGEVKVA